MGTTPDVRVPGNSVDSAATDVAEPASDLLTRIELLPAQEDAVENKVGVIGGTPYSLQVITAGALGINKGATTAIAALGGVTVILAAVEGWWVDEGPAVHVAVVAGLAFLLVGLALAIAIIVRGDTQARAQATAMQYYSRAAVASAFLGLIGTSQTPPSIAPAPTAPTMDQLLPLLSSQPGLTVSGEGLSEATVSGVRRLLDGSIEIHTDGDWVPLSRVKNFALEQQPSIEDVIVEVLSKLNGQDGA